MEHTFRVKQVTIGKQKYYFFGHIDMQDDDMDFNISKTLGLSIKQFRKIARGKWKTRLDRERQLVFYTHQAATAARNYFEIAYMTAQKLRM